MSRLKGFQPGTAAVVTASYGPRYHIFDAGTPVMATGTVIKSGQSVWHLFVDPETGLHQYLVEGRDFTLQEDA